MYRIRIYREIPDPFQGDFEFCSKNRYILKEFQTILWLISWSLPDDEGGITCMEVLSLSKKLLDELETFHLEILKKYTVTTN